jgi:hypothetical protein
MISITSRMTALSVRSMMFAHVSMDSFSMTCQFLSVSIAALIHSEPFIFSVMMSFLSCCGLYRTAFVDQRRTGRAVRPTAAAVGPRCWS